MSDAVSSAERSRGARRRVLLLLVGVVVLTSPALRNHDSFPLSTYPVYATARPRQATFVTAYGVTSDGLEHRLSMDVIARTDDPLIAASRTADAVAAGESDELCADIARRAPADYVAVIVVHEEHDVVDAARGDDSILGRDDLANCRVSS